MSERFCWEKVMKWQSNLEDLLCATQLNSHHQLTATSNCAQDLSERWYCALQTHTNTLTRLVYTASISVPNRQVILERSLIVFVWCSGDHARRSRDSALTPDPLSLCQDDINDIVACFSAVFEFFSYKWQLIQLYCSYRALHLFANCNDVQFS